MNFMLERLVKIQKLKRNESYHFQGQHFMQIQNQIILIYLVRFVQKTSFSNKCPKVTDIVTLRKNLRDSGRCFMCLRSGHKISECTSTKTCYYCKERHNSALCVKREKGIYQSKKILLFYYFYFKLLVRLTNKINSKSVKARVLFDSAS